jgi:hypothetical protein
MSLIVSRHRRCSLAPPTLLRADAVDVAAPVLEVITVEMTGGADETVTGTGGSTGSCVSRSAASEEMGSLMAMATAVPSSSPMLQATLVVVVAAADCCPRCFLHSSLV